MNSLKSSAVKDIDIDIADILESKVSISANAISTQLYNEPTQRSQQVANLSWWGSRPAGVMEWYPYLLTYLSHQTPEHLHFFCQCKHSSTVDDLQ